MKAPLRTPLLSPGREAEWAQINREEAEHHRAYTTALSPSERLQVGQRLSQQAVELLAASIRAGHVPDELSGPDLNGVVADANAVGLQYVVIGGFSVIANGYLRTTNDSDLLISDDPAAGDAIVRFLDRVEAKRLYDGKQLTRQDIVEAQHLRVSSCHGIIDILRGGLPPLDFDTVAERALSLDVNGQQARVADLRSIVSFKRLANRPRDRNDLLELEALHGPLPIEPIPGLDD